MRRIIVAATLALFATAPALAGTTGILSGTVIDARGKALSEVRVTINSPASVCRTTSDARGAFICMALPPDVYTVSLERETYATVAHAGVTVFSDHVSIVRDCLCDSDGVRLLAAKSLTDEYIVNGTSVANWDLRQMSIAEMLQAVPGVVVAPVTARVP